jgi:ribose transport system substrate-binding protein
VAAFLASSANTYWQAALEGVREAAADAGADINITVFDSEFDANIQKNQLRDALVSEQFDVWFIGPNDGSALVQEITEAVGKDIAVGCTLVPCGADIRATEVQIDGVVAEAGIPFYENGQHLGELTVKACGDDDPCKVVWMPGLPSLPLEKARTDGLMSVLNEHSNIEVVATQGGEYLAAPALEATQDILQANPDTSVIVSSGDQMIVGAEKAVRAAGVEGEVALIGNGATTDGVEAIDEGRWFGSAAYLPKTEAKEVADLLFKVARGEQDVEGRWIDPLELTGADPLITKENADSFEPEFQG